MTSLIKRLPGSAPRFAARAPGRLDVMGGIGDYAGSLVLNTTLADHVCVAAQRRTDQTVSILFVTPAGLDGSAPVTFPLAKLVGQDGAPVDAAQGRKLAGDGFADHTLCVLGVLVEMLRAGVVPHLGGGLSIVVGSTLGEITDAGEDAAHAAAVLVAAAGVLEAKIEPLSAAAICQGVQNDWLKLPVGPADAVAALLGEPRTLTQLRCDPCALAGTIRLPDDLLLIGIDCGIVHPDLMQRYEHVRTAAFMGRFLIDRIIEHEGRDHSHWDGYLSRISITDYVEWFRDRLPTKMKGREFLDRFGETGDPLTRIEPDFVYRLRSRTEHHIYEHARAHRFAECLSRAIRSTDPETLAEISEPMYSSHWSYGQRCGLGSVATDLLVTLLRRHETAVGIFGAKITGRGCGGVVTVLVRETDRALAAVEAALADYEARTGRAARVLRDALPGALVAGAQRT